MERNSDASQGHPTVSIQPDVVPGEVMEIKFVSLLFVDSKGSVSGIRQVYGCDFPRLVCSVETIGSLRATFEPPGWRADSGGRGATALRRVLR